MELLLFRHGIAEADGPDGTDESRRLTEEGVDKTAQAARGLAKVIDPPEAILTSPLVRAVETARIVAAVFDLEPDTLDALGHGSPVDIVEQIATRSEQSLMLVGHEPSLSCTAELLCTGSSDRFLQLKKAGCICLDVEFSRDLSEVAAALKWLATPKMLRALDAG